MPFGPGTLIRTVDTYLTDDGLLNVPGETNIQLDEEGLAALTLNYYVLPSDLLVQLALFSTDFAGNTSIANAEQVLRTPGTACEDHNGCQAFEYCGSQQPAVSPGSGRADGRFRCTSHTLPDRRIW